MNEYLARENIKRFKQRLRASSDDLKKATLRRLIEAEQQRLAEVLKHEISASSVGESTYMPRIKDRE